MGDLRQYYIVDATLPMHKGKIAAQCAHGALLAHMIYERRRAVKSPHYGSPDTVSMVQQYHQWFNGDMTKIVLKGNADTLVKAEQEYGDKVAVVVDNGYTDIPSNTKTVVVLPLMAKENAPDWLQQLKPL